jgi:hypothetical protein
MPSRKALRDPHDPDIRRVAMAICRETCAQMGEPNCIEVSRDLKQNWPPETCQHGPGCLLMATVALVAFLNPDYMP